MPPQKRARAENVGAAPSAEESRLASSLFGAPPAASSSSAAGASVSASAAPAALSAAPPAWVDEDDAGATVDLRATRRLRKLRVASSEAALDGVEYEARLRARFATTADAAGADVGWARAPASGDGEKRADVVAVAAAAAMATAGGVLQASSALAPGELAVSRVRDANIVAPARAVVRSIAWHPGVGAGVVAIGAHDGTLRIFRADGVANSIVAAVPLRDLPIYSVGWTGDGSEVIATGRRSFFYAYDIGAGRTTRVPRLLGRDEASLESAVVSPGDPASSTSLIAFLGNDGTTLLASARSKQWVGNLKAPVGSVRAAAFSRGPTGGGGGAGSLDFPELITTGSHGEVIRWDLRAMKPLARYADEGSTGGTAIAAHPSGKSFAVGSSLGVVNVYNTASIDAAAVPRAGTAAVSSIFASARVLAPKPAQTYLNLTLAVDHLSYGGPAGELLVMSSSRTRDSLRLAHAASGTVFGNWPTPRTPLACVTAGAAVSPGGGFLAVGNDKGRVLLYRLTHFASA